ncbi:TetR/AcrR family transcriptional regulator [Marinobacter psychrophilus]|uniref:TetR/AcrR family transcriptional regulator n=1 Tax=Marinobacter psychrophilus TaxID=330734 RepID=UPI001B46713C|nr:TetR/AcrR family transcriptional regulator [Marinobacter psychrophilus]MBQ0764026.1 TetR/AcrR family transcriptional regulator [Marinobacter psychrophilus]MBQ0844806.1 TetR/AcrR family transcriptional regulator [Marinobacter psychrophilus]
MKSSSKRQDSIRAPQQARSQQRVELILKAAKQLILEKGCAGLKMTDIAVKAAITVGSIYQYFPNKSAIIAGLGEHYLEANHRGVAEALAVPPATTDELLQISLALLDGYYQLHREDPVVRDIWMGSATDKEFRAVDDNDTQRSVDLIFERTKHLFKPRQSTKVKLAIMMIILFGSAAVAAAVKMDEKEGRSAMDTAKLMQQAIWEMTFKSLGRNT